MTDLNGKLNTAEPLLYAANCSLRTQIYISIKIPARIHYSGTYLMFFVYFFFLSSPIHGSSPEFLVILQKSRRPLLEPALRVPKGTAPKPNCNL